ncbi:MULTISPECIES: FixH family protein [Stenotrophomonas]|uniref:FixH family protein n=1 Tax=Stenotrophomonas TaxID=40323 RepID=UPI000BD29A28|nr:MULTISPECIES: FixH family protein [Stenotrophomonas]MCA7024122.1 FixH family protein [Stenotrophomonas acidaminiphila]MCE4076767.1 FixH family protein [Stenotrophomonas acidaminiphila]OZB51295.1 MAG: nitrogen fixation protein FixH [Stenotrophomonas sp. 14-69-23]WHL20041.1 FixH family protein [Stenotrophomonas acidaminiphila]
MNERSRSPWRVPVFWLVVGLPLLSIVAGVGLVIIAVRSGGADVVSDPVQRVSQIQTTDLGPDEAAAKLGLSAVLRVEDGVVEVLPATGKFATGAPLQLVLEHPTRQSDDLRLELLPQGPGWRVQQAVDGEHDWVVQLRDGEGRWRLHGRLPKQQHAARLSPSLGGEH